MADDIPPQPSPHHVWSGWWLVVAQDVPRGSSPASWLVAWLPVGHRHVWLAQEVAPGFWLTASALATHFVMRIEAEDGQTLGMVPSITAKGMTAARVGHWIDTRRPWFRGPLSCVAVAKMVTGARWFWVWTPGQFIRRAEREGFEVIRP